MSKALTHAVIGAEPGESKMKALASRADVKRIDEDGLFELVRSAALSAKEQAELAKKANDKQAAADKKLAQETAVSVLDLSPFVC